MLPPLQHINELKFQQQKPRPTRPRNVVAEALTSALATRPKLDKLQRDLEYIFNFQIKSLLQVRGTCDSEPQLVDMLGRARKKVRGVLPSQTPNPAHLQREKPAKSQSRSSGPPATFTSAPEMEVESPRPVTENTAPSPSTHHVPAQTEDMDDISEIPRGDTSCLAAVTTQPRKRKKKSKTRNDPSCYALNVDHPRKRLGGDPTPPTAPVTAPQQTEW